MPKPTPPLSPEVSAYIPRLLINCPQISIKDSLSSSWFYTNPLMSSFKAAPVAYNSSDYNLVSEGAMLMSILF